jgi:hypothetical protein
VVSLNSGNEAQQLSKNGSITMKTKTLYKRDTEKVGISRFPNFHKSGSIAGMKRLYYGKNALLVRCGSWIYNVSSEPEIYYNIAH